MRILRILCILISVGLLTLSVNLYSASSDLPEEKPAEPDVKTNAGGPSIQPSPDELPKPTVQKGLGFSAGFTSGVGFTYESLPEDSWGFRITGVPFIYSDSLFGSLGFSFLKNIQVKETYAVYLSVGQAVFYNGSEEFDSSGCNLEGADPETCTGSTGWAHTLDFVSGIGAGLNLELSKNLFLSIELPLGVSWGINFPGVGFNYAGPMINSAVIYRFD